MARGATKDLYLQVSGDIRGLRAATAAGKTVLNEFGGAAVNVLEEVEREMAKLGSSGLPSLKAVEASYTATFKRMSDQARAVIDAPTPQAAVQIIDAGASQQAAANATSQAAALRLVAEAAARADLATGGTDAATRAFAVSAASAAVQAENEAQALREQAAVLSSVERQLGGHVVAQRRSVQMTGEQRAGFNQLAMNMGDVATSYNAGTSASIIFSQQFPQMIQAVSLMTNESKGLIGVLGSPWVQVFGAAVVVATPLVAKLFEGADGSEDMRSKTLSLVDALAAERISTDAARKALADYNEEKKRARDNDKLATIETVKAARARLLEAIATRQQIKAEIERQLSRFGPGSGQDPNAALGSLSGLQINLDRQTGLVNELGEAFKNLNIDFGENAAKAAADPIEAIRQSYTRLKQELKEASGLAADYPARAAKLAKDEKRDVEKKQTEISAATRTTADRQFGRDIDLSRATEIVASIGGRVTSGIRSTERQAELYAAKQAGRHNGPVAKPGSSAHEAGGPYDAIDIAYGPGISVKSIREAFAKEGVKLRKILNEPGQRVFHVEFPTGRPSVGSAERKEDAARRKAEAEDNRRTQNADEFASLLGRTQDDQLRLQRQRTTSISEAADLDVQAVVQAREDVERAAQKGVVLKKWTQEQADAVKAVARGNAVLEVAAIREEERARLAERKFEIEQADLEDKQSLLRLQDQLAGTAEERRAIARKLLRVEQQMFEDALRQRIAAEKDPERKAQLERRLAQVPEEYKLKGEKLERDNADPLQRYGQQLLDDTNDLEDRLKGVAADGFGALEDASARATASAITDFLQLGGVAGDVINGIIADLAKLAIKKAIIEIVGPGFFGLKDGGPVLKRAGGGPVFGPGGPRDDVIPTLLSNGEFVINAASTSRYRPLIEAINDGRLPRFADGGLVAPASFVPRLPSITGAQRALAGASGRTIVHQHSWTVNAQGAILAEGLVAEMRAMGQAAVVGGANLARTQIADQASMALE